MHYVAMANSWPIAVTHSPERAIEACEVHAREVAEASGHDDVRGTIEWNGEPTTETCGTGHACWTGEAFWGYAVVEVAR